MNHAVVVYVAYLAEVNTTVLSANVTLPLWSGQMTLRRQQLTWTKQTHSFILTDKKMNFRQTGPQRILNILKMYSLFFNVPSITDLLSDYNNPESQTSGSQLLGFTVLVQMELRCASAHVSQGAYDGEAVTQLLLLLVMMLFQKSFPHFLSELITQWRVQFVVIQDHVCITRVQFTVQMLLLLVFDVHVGTEV